MPDAELERQIQRSWILNAPAWTDAVRQGKIPSRKAGSNAAILNAVLESPCCRVLDLGCGEGWLCRALTQAGYQVTGVDSSDSLVAEASVSGGGRFLRISYEELLARPDQAAGPFNPIVANFSLLGENLEAPLQAARARLAPDGALLIHTLHPTSLPADEPYQSGWRTETFAAISGDFPAHMPYYFRTFEDWIDVLRNAGFVITRCREPLSTITHRPLSLLLECRNL